MRFLLLLVACGLLFLSAPGFAQVPDTAVLRISRLPISIVTPPIWRYHVGDNPAWARPDFDASAWDTLNPRRPQQELPPALSTGISWLRLRFRLSDSLQQRELLLNAWQLGASEVYLNGRLVQRQGQLHANPEQVQPRGRFPQPGVMLAGGPEEQVLAVRLAPWQPPLSLRNDQELLFTIGMFSPQQFWQGVAEIRDQARIYLVMLGFSVLMTLLHLAFYYYNPTLRANRYFACYALTAALACVAVYYGRTFPFATHTSYLGAGIAANSLGGMIGLWTVRALYDLFRVRPGRVYTALWVAYGLLALLGAVSLLQPMGSLGVLTYVLMMLLPIAEQLRLTGRAVRQGQRGAQIVAVGFAGGLLAALAYSGLPFVLPRSVVVEYSILGDVLVILVFTLPALGISLFLAREFALDSQLLQVKLSEVEQLSAQTLAQEQEKQALLAQQNETLEQQVTQRTEQLQLSLTDLRATQAQLIQKEKMASLGELTAGIAHEIQNPLNFVNNFSEVSTELIAELEEAQAAGDAAEASALAADVRQNLIKITQHGQRAAGIVRGMLEHSRTSAGERQPTDLNRLTEEYLRLAYQGQRASDKTFNATLHTEFAADLAPVDMVGADVGRVLLNLFNNAFYAVQKRQQRGEVGYQPTVRVETQRVNGQVNIRVQDNGTGIPAEVQAKIFQPFFTTKPTGEGTGLGLSLSHDIIAQGHGGTLSVESEQGGGSTFTITLPV